MIIMLYYHRRFLHNSKLISFKRVFFTKNIQNNHKHVSFGYTQVLENERQPKGNSLLNIHDVLVNEVFNSVSSSYDLMNDIMSFGVHRIWKNLFVEKIRPIPGLSYLDVAGGTGDIAFRILERIKENCDVNTRMTICDINKNMMEAGQSRSEIKPYLNLINWQVGNAESLPFDENSFDVYTIAFGIRNCTHIDKVLSEAYRVLKPFGRFYCLEFSSVSLPLLKNIYDSYSMQIIPVLGQLVAGDWKSYQYLVESVRKFPNQQDFASMIKLAGFKAVDCTNYSAGITAVHFGIK